jgi:AAA+ ATPase superfamily predicted ATPase
MENPFHFNQVVLSRDFCEREEIDQIAPLLESGQNVVLIGPRRTGKTSLALEVCRRLKIKVIHADLMRVRSYEQAVKRLAEAALRDGKAPRIESFVKSLIHLRPAFTVDPISGGAQWTVTPGKADDAPSGLIDILRRIKGRAVDMGAVLFIDEFQDITGLPDHEELLAEMRSEIQKWKKPAVIFAGSDREQMLDLFTNPKKPFYQSAVVVPIDQIDRKKFTSYIVRRFSAGGKTLTKEMVSELLDLTQNHPNSTQKLLHNLWFLTAEGETVTGEKLAEALDRTVRMEQNEFERAFGNLTRMQEGALRAVAHLGGEETNSAPFLDIAEIRNHSTATKSLQRLCQLGILINKDGVYQFTNPFFRHWLVRLP